METADKMQSEIPNSKCYTLKSKLKIHGETGERRV